jgi:hypothetical protein
LAEILSQRLKERLVENVTRALGIVQKRFLSRGGGRPWFWPHPNGRAATASSVCDFACDDNGLAIFEIDENKTLHPR